VNEGHVAFQIEHAGQCGTLELNFREWAGTTIEIDFVDRLYDNAGTIRLDGCTSRAAIGTERAYRGPLADGRASDDYFASILRMFSNAYTFGWSPAPGQMVTYDESYHSGNNYTHGDPGEIAIKQVQAEIIRRLADPGRCLVAGCSNGELVRQCRRAGIAAHGFDVIPNLDRIAFEEVRDYMRVGSLTNIPYSRSEGFDTLVAVDVMEHIPERDLPRVSSEWARMGFRKLVLLINLNQFWFPGHITLRPISWWEAQWKPRFDLSRVAGRFEDLPTVYSNNGLYNQQWTLWERSAPAATVID
jgi:hypothetical protein